METIWAGQVMTVVGKEYEGNTEKVSELTVVMVTSV